MVSFSFFLYFASSHYSKVKCHIEALTVIQNNSCHMKVIQQIDGDLYSQVTPIQVWLCKHHCGLVILQDTVDYCYRLAVFNCSRTAKQKKYSVESEVYRDLSQISFHQTYIKLNVQMFKLLWRFAIIIIIIITSILSWKWELVICASLSH